MDTRTWRGLVFIATSLDGFIARNDGDIDWLTRPAPEVVHTAPAHEGESANYEAFMDRVDHVVMGRATYEKVLTFDHWPYGRQRTIVLSTSLAGDLDDRITVTRSLAGTDAQLRAAGARGVYVDGGATIRAFLAEGFIDEITITRAPVLLGEGLPLFGALPRDIRLSLRASATTAPGLTHATYDVLAD